MGCGASKKYESDKAPVVTVTRRATETQKPEKEHKSKKDREKEKESTVNDDAVAEAANLEESFSSAGLGRMTVMGSDYCEKQGIKDAAELLAQEEAFSAALNLKPLERQRLRKQLGRKDEEAKVELEPTLPAMRPAPPAPPPPAPVATFSIPTGLDIPQAEEAAPAADEAAPAAGDATAAASDTAPAAAEAVAVAGEEVPPIASDSSVEVGQADKPGGSASSAATAASPLPVSEGSLQPWLPEGVYEAMIQADIAYMSDNASSWCQTVGCIYLAEVRDNIEHFSMYMQLSDEEVDLLCDAMKVPDDQRRNSFVNSPSTMSTSVTGSRSTQKKETGVSRSSTGSADCLIELLEEFDPNATGLVKTEDLKHWLATLGMELSDKEADEMIKMACPDADGMVDYSKFVREMMSSPSPTARRCTRTLTGDPSQDIS